MDPLPATAPPPCESYESLAAPVEVVDFGTLTFAAETVSLPLFILNADPYGHELAVISAAPANALVSFAVRATADGLGGVSLSLPAGQTTQIATATFAGRTEGTFSGAMIVQTKGDAPPVEVPYMARVLHGSLAWELNHTSFFTSPTSAVRRAAFVPAAFRPCSLETTPLHLNCVCRTPPTDGCDLPCGRSAAPSAPSPSPTTSPSRSS